MTEQDRISASKAQAEAIAATRRDADEAHRERIHAEIAEDLESQSLRGAMDWAGPCIVETIAAGRIRHLAINY
jgi:hypothetical protein